MKIIKEIILSLYEKVSVFNYHSKLIHFSCFFSISSPVDDEFKVPDENTFNRLHPNYAARSGGGSIPASVSEVSFQLGKTELHISQTI